MKKTMFLIAVLLSLILAACGGGGDVVEQARATAEGVAQDVTDAAEGAADAAQEAVSDLTGDPLCNVNDIPQATQADVTVRFVNNTDGQVAIIWRDVDQSPPVLTEYTVLATGESYDQETFVGHEWIAEDQAGNGVVEYTATDDATQCLVIEADALVVVPPAGPTGETFEVDPTQPITVADENGTEVSIEANTLVDEDGNPPAGDVTVNIFTVDVADEGDEAEACVERLTVWSYNEMTGLWEELDPAPIDDDGCVEPVANVAVDVTDDAGNEYGLAEGETAEVSAPCQPEIDQVLTVWSYDETTGLWVEEGSATVENETCTAEVSNLSNVNFVAQDPVTSMSGMVVDLDSGEPLAGAQVCVQGSDQCATVDESGSYMLSELDAAEYVFEVTATDYVTATQTISLAAGETLAQDFALTATNPVLAVLPEEVVLRGVIFCIGDLSCSIDEATAEVGATFQFVNTNVNGNYPDYNLSNGDFVLGVRFILPVGDVSILVPKQSETELGQAANAVLLANSMPITVIGDTNQPLQQDDQMEVVLTDPTSSNPPYTVNFYRGEGEARQLVSTFTIDKQQ